MSARKVMRLKQQAARDKFLSTRRESMMELHTLGQGTSPEEYARLWDEHRARAAEAGQAYSDTLNSIQFAAGNYDRIESGTGQ